MNQAPRATGTIPEQVVAVDSAVVVDVATYFVDPDGDTLTYAAVSSSEANATVTVVGSAVTVTGIAAGGATVTVTARDPEGLSAQQTFAVMVPNREPVAVGAIDSLNVFVDSVAQVDVAEYFTDPDGDDLEYRAASSDTTLAAVAVSGSMVTVTGAGVGSVNVTVTARDTAGLSAEQSFVVTVPNRAPRAVGTIAEQVVEVDSLAVLDVVEYFTDPDRQELEYSAAASDTTRVTVSVSGGEVTVAGVAKGNATLTVTAADPGGLTAEQSFVVTVPNRPPHAVEAITDRDVYVFDTIGIEAAAHFSDPDGDSLAYTATSSDTTLAAVSVSDGVVMVAGMAVGSVTVTVTATDPEGLAAEQDFAVTMPNRAPETVGTVADQDVYVGDSVTVDVAANFAEPDGQDLEYAAATSNAAAATVAVSGSEVTVRGVAVGMATVTVTARDPGGLWAEQQFPVTVPNRAPETVGVIADRELEVDSVLEVEVAEHFTEPDGEALEYSAASSDTTRVMVAIAGSVLTARGVRAGHATVTVVVSDPGGLTAELSFGVTVANRPPVAVGVIADRVVRAGDTQTVDVGNHFEDPDGDVLGYFAASSDTTRLRASTLGRVVTLRGVAGGSATVTVTARDPEGLTARQTFGVTVPNQAPRTVGTIEDRRLERDSTLSLEVSAHFTDPDGDDLTYGATSSNRARARVSTSGSTVTVRGVSAGVATITVTAGDPEGLVASQSFDVTVVRPNRAPRPTTTIPDQVLAPGEMFSVDLSALFTDPDGDELEYSATSSSSAVASVALSGDAATVTGHAAGGTATITVTATDPGGLSAEQRFDVRVEDSPNRAPVVIGRIRDLNALVGQRFKAPLALVFEDPDGDPLTYATTSSNTSVVEPEVVEDTIFVSAVGPGSATVSVTATDPEGLSATVSFEVNVALPGGFDLWLGFTGAVTETQKGWFRAARSTWESVLAPTELTDVQVPDPVRCLNIAASLDEPVDDHLVLVHVRPIDGFGGTLARARYCYTRASDGSPVVSAAIFDEADIDHLMSINMLGVVAFHEFAHGLGFASRYWDHHGLLDTGSDPHFRGARAIDAFNAAGGTNHPGAKVPISPDHSHWREDVFGREGMTPLLTLGATNPFSAITLQAMADVGYQVDLSWADDYQLPNTIPPELAADETGQVFDLSNDVVHGPVVVLGRDGSVLRVIPAPVGSTEPFFDHQEVVRIERLNPYNAREGGLTLVPPARGSIWRLVRPAARRP